MIEKYVEPFVHYKIKNFLSDTNFTTIKDIYNRLEFFEKHTDLFKFLQTNELKEEHDLNFFKDCLMDISDELKLPKSTDIDLFASYYRKGDYLLCHDDLIDDRQYAFSYYIDEYESGELILFNNEANKEIKRIDVTRNTLVIFQVSSVSFHEVNYCQNEERKAFTGWFHFDQKHELLPYKKFEYVQILAYQLTDLISPDVDIDNDISVVDDLDITVEIIDQKLLGPFYSRRVYDCNQSPLLVIFKDLDLLYKNVYKFEDGCYLLLNDSVNEIEGDIYDFYYFIRNDGMVIQYANMDGEVEFELNGVELHGYLIRRNGRKLFIERTSGTSIIKHYIYIRK